ncbi:MAG: hypothetical protein ABJA98_07170 [Acidobacteriota bacterium]
MAKPPSRRTRKRALGKAARRRSRSRHTTPRAGSGSRPAHERGNPWLKTTLVQVAWVAARTQKTYLRAQFLRLKSRRGPKKAILAVVASMLTAAYYMLKDNVTYVELGAVPTILNGVTRRRRRAASSSASNPLV